MKAPPAAEEAKPAEAAPPSEEAKPAEEAVPAAEEAKFAEEAAPGAEEAKPAEEAAPAAEEHTDQCKKEHIIRKIAPAQCDIAETRTAFFLGVKEEKKKRKNGKKKGRQTRHFWRGRKPLEAEKALRKLWETKTKHPTEHACTILAKLIACYHLTSNDFARCKLVQEWVPESPVVE